MLSRFVVAQLGQTSSFWSTASRAASKVLAQARKCIASFLLILLYYSPAYT